MSKMNREISIQQLEQIEKQFAYRLRCKKRLNILICTVTFLFGISAVIFTYFHDPNPYLYNFRYLTFSGGLFATLVSGVFAFLSYLEYRKNIEIFNVPLYYLRLSAATTEFVVFTVALANYLPFSPQGDFPFAYDYIVLHFVVTLLTLFSFIQNDPPIGRLKPLDRCNGLIFLCIYTAGVLTALLTDTLTGTLIPYFFLDIKHNPLWMTGLSFILIYTLGYLLSWLLSELNRKYSWYWFRNLSGRR